MGGCDVVVFVAVEAGPSCSLIFGFGASVECSISIGYLFHARFPNFFGGLRP